MKRDPSNWRGQSLSVETFAYSNTRICACWFPAVLGRLEAPVPAPAQTLNERERNVDKVPTSLCCTAFEPIPCEHDSCSEEEEYGDPFDPEKFQENSSANAGTMSDLLPAAKSAGVSDSDSALRPTSKSPLRDAIPPVDHAKQTSCHIAMTLQGEHPPAVDSKGSMPLNY